MNYFAEGLQGSGKSTLVRKISEKHPECIAVLEGDYSPVELAWCAYTDEKTCREILDRYPEMRQAIEEKTYAEGDRRIICYTKVPTENGDFYRDLEQYEIYNNRLSREEFRSVILSRFGAFSGDGMIFECSLFQNIVEDMIMFQCASDDEIIALYREIREALEGVNYHIVYLKAEDIKGNLALIRKERSDDQGNELWFPMMMEFFNDSPYAKLHGVAGEEDLINHFIHRQNLELRICREVFDGKYTVLPSKKYSDADLEF